MPTSSQIAAFTSIVGEANVTADETPLRIAPATTEEVAAVLRVCSMEQHAVMPTGGGTKLDWGNPVAPQVLLDTTHITGLREHVWQDMTCTVAAGTPWVALQQQLAQHNQRVALDPLFATKATVGGAIAVNDSGSLRLRYGSLRDLVLGMTIVLTDGTIARSGGKVVKNVAGYDLPKLLTGSFGTLGVITEVTFRLHPTQQHTATWTIPCSDAAILAALQQQLLHVSMSIEGLQTRMTTEGFALDVHFAALPDVLKDHAQRLQALAGGLSLQTADEEVWLERERLFSVPGATVLKITALPSKLAPILEGFRTLTGMSDIRVHAVADAIGILTLALVAAPAQTVALIDDLRARLRADGGMVVVLRSGADVAPDLDRWGGSPPAIAVMREIKQQFDPQRILNPGKFVGGI